MSRLAFDTSAAVPLLLRSHAAHTAVVQFLGKQQAMLTAHSLAETYAVLTRLRGDARVAPDDAVRLLRANFAEVLVLKPSTMRTLPAVLAPLGIVGGAVYDGLVALTAKERKVPLLTRDARAVGTYAVIGAEVQTVRS